MVYFISACTAFLLLFLMLAFPMVLQLLYIKALLFVVLLIMVTGRIVWTGRVRLDRRIMAWTLFLLCVTTFFALRGAVFNSTGALKQIQVYGLWPIIYVFLMAGADDIRLLKGFHKTIIFSAIVISIYGLTALLMELNFLPKAIDFTAFLSNDGDFRIGVNDNQLGISFAGINSMPFIVPYILGALYTSKNNSSNSKVFLILSIILSLILVFASSRRAIYLILLLSPLLIVFFDSFNAGVKLGKSIKYLVIISMGIVALLFLTFLVINSFFDVNFLRMVDDFFNGFYFSRSGADASTFERLEQYSSLIDGWVQHPLLGFGFGSGASYVRDPEMPWAYELFYIALFFQVGVLGFIAYLSGVIWIYWTGIRVIRQGGIHSHLMLPTLVGLSGYLIANATNPYLVRFDGLWAIFLPVLIINSWFFKQKC